MISIPLSLVGNQNLIPFIFTPLVTRIRIINCSERTAQKDAFDCEGLSVSLLIVSARDHSGSAMDRVAERFDFRDDTAASTATTTTTTTPLSTIAEAFEDLAKLVSSERGQLRLDTFCDSCSPIAILFSSLGLAFKFAELEFVSKVHNLVEASMVYSTLQSVLDSDVANQTVKTRGSNSRNLRRVRQGLDLIRALFEQFLSNDDYYLKNAASTAYAQVCAPYHSWTVRTAVAAGMYTLPTREQLLLKLNETNHSAEKKMKRYIRASIPVIEYIDKLYLSRNIRLDW